MGAGASTEFNAEAVLADEGDPTEPMADEGYDSDLAGDIRELAYHRPRPKPVKPELETTRGRLSAYPEVGGKAAVLPCAEHIHKPTAYPFDHPPDALERPEDTLKLEHVHGYRSHDVRANIAYDVRGNLVFPAAAVGVVMNTTTRKQTFFNAHADDLLCLAAHPSGQVVATAQVGNKSPIHIWKTIDGERVATIFPPHGAATLNLAFSADGRFLASVGADEEHTVCVHEWETNPQTTNVVDYLRGPHFAGTIVATEKFGRNPPYVMKYNPTDGRLVIGGKLTLKFYQMDGDALRVTPAVYAHGARKGYAQCSVLSLAFLPDGSTFGGTAKGDVYKYEEGGSRAVRKFGHLHHGPIHDMCFTGKCLVTAGKDGKVKLWSVFMKPEFQLSVAKVAETLLDEHWAPRSYQSGKSPSVKAVAASSDGRTLAVGLSTSEIFEFAIDVVGDARQKEEASSKTARLSVQGHCGAIDPRTGLDEGDVWDLATHPKLPIFATVGEDRSIRVWSLKEKRMLRQARLPAKGRSVAWHPTEGCDHVAVGTFGGAVIVVDYLKGTTVAVAQHAPDGAPITALRYSPCGKFLGLACQDGRFRVLDVHCAYKLVDQTDAVENPDADFLGKKAKKSDAGKAAMTHVDWSSDSKFVQINTAGADLKFFTAPQCDQVPSASPEILACDWATWSLPYGWASQGAWKPESMPGDINAVARCNKGDWLEGERVLAVADDFGTVRLARYPANVGVSAEREYYGHSARVTACEFSASDKWLITTGGGDRCVFVWRHKDPDGPADGPDGPSPHTRALDAAKADARTAPPDMSAGDAPADDDTDSDEEDNIDYDDGKSLVPKVMVQSGMEHGVGMYTPVNAEDGVPNPYKNHSLAELGCRRGYRSPMIGKPVLAQTHVPSWWRKESTSYDVPKSRLKLSWAYGYRGFDTRQNVFYNAKGELVYHTAAVGVVYNPIYETQKHITDDPESDDIAEGNTDDIVSMARHPDKTTFATGEIGRKPKIVVWSSDDCKPLAVLQGFHRKAVRALCFSPCGKYLASVGQDSDHSVAIYDWQKEELLATYKGDKERVLDINWSAHNGDLVTTGVKHVKFVEGCWAADRAIEKGQIFTPRRATFGSIGKWQNFYAATFTGPGRTVIGTQKGQLYVFEGRQLVKVVPQAHAGKVTAVYCLEDENVLFSGGDDGIVRFWKADDLSPLHQIRIESAMSADAAPINSITTDVKSKVLVGTKIGEIWEISDEARLVVEAHGKGEIWGIALHPSDEHKMATCSDDGTLRLWNITPGKGRSVYARAWPRKEDAKPIAGSTSLNTGCVRSVAWHPDGKSLSVGTVAGKVHVYEYYEYKGEPRLTCIRELDGRREWISDIKYSPCTPEDPSGGRYLAVGSHDNVVDIYDTKKPNAEYELAGTCKGHSSFITHLGWSKDGNTLYTNSGDYELLFWYAPKGVRIVNGVDVKDVAWADTTGVLGFETTGVWHKGSDGTDVNSADVTVVHGDHGHEERVLATGDDRGVVSLFRAPALGGKPITYGGHSSHVTTVRFSKDGTKLFSCGGGDATVLQWEVIPDGRGVVPAGGADGPPKQTMEHEGENIAAPAAPASPPQQQKKSRW